MQVQYYEDREDDLKTVMADAVGAAVQRAVDDPDVRAVTVHKPGSEFEDSRGRKYRVAEDGSIRRRRGDSR